MPFRAHRLIAFALAVALASLSGCSCDPRPDEPVSLVISELPDGTAGHAYSASVSATDGTPPYTFTAQDVPSGFTLDTAGAIRGTPAGSGDFTLQITVADAEGQTDSDTFQLKVFPAIAFTTTALPSGTTGTAYSATVGVTGGKPPVIVRLVSGALPAGIALASGALSGTPSAAGIATLTLTAEDANGASASAGLALDVRDPVTVSTTSLVDGYAGRAYGSASLAAAGGAAPYTWSIASGALPSGLSLSAGGAISGMPAAPETASVTVQVSDRDGRVATQALSLVVFAPTAIAAGACPDGYLTQAYAAQWSATGGKAPLSWTVSSGALPGGISLGSSTGAIAGTPAAAGQASAEVTVTDANGVSDTRTCAVDVYALPAIATTTPLPELTAGDAATGTFTATGGKSPLAWTATGALPTGLSLNASSGAYAGTVDAAATNGQTWSFDVFVTDANGRQSSRTFSATAWRTPVIDTTSLANATEYAAYAPTPIQAHDGKAPLTYAISGLPSGLSVDSASGVLSGTPSALSRGPYPLTMTVTDSGGRIATASPSLTVLPGTPTVDSVSPGFGTVSGGTRVTVTGTNFFGAIVTVSGQQAQVSVSADGTTLDLTTPAGSGPGPVTISVTNDSNLSLNANFTYTLERTIDPDGSSADWTPAFRVGTNAAPSAWPSTDLQALYAAYDADNFYIGVAGTLDPTTGNTLILYVDADPGTGSGVTDYSTLQDNNGDLDNACTNDGTGTGQWVKAHAMFAPDFCTGTKNLTTVPLGASWPDNEQGGLRGLNVVTDYPWIVDYQGRNLVAIASSQTNGFTEFLIPWKSLYPATGAPPLPRASVALVARIVDATGNLIADQTLPQDDDANPKRISQIAEVDVRVTPPRATAAAPWYQGAVFYTALVRSFQDSTGDGHGDLNGLRSRLDYLNDGNPATTTDLGVDALWLMPIFQSPSYHGYDASDYDQVETDYGTLADFQALTAAAHQRGMKVYLDLALNHTSDQHPWFVDSASSPTSVHRDWYVWSPADLGWTQPWSTDPVWHPRNGAWYYGLFFTALPDLNYRTDAVRLEMKRVAAQWIQRGADGYRLDATPYLIEDGPADGQWHTPGTHQYLKEIRDHVASFNPTAAVVAENWTDTRTIARYYGKRTVRGGDEVQMSFNFPLADRIIESLFTQNGIPVASKLVELRAAYPFGAVDAPFLANHDQNRISTVVGNDPQKLRIAAAILLTLPGTPFIYYGEELGAQSSTTPGDESKRAPMAWDATGSGFTSGTPWTPFAPGLATANVASQTGDPDSLLSRYRQLIRTRKGSPALSAGQGLEVLTPSFGFDPLLVFVRTDGAERVVVAHNLSNSAWAGTYPLRAGSLQPLFMAPGATASGEPGNWTISLPAYGTAVWREQP